jgi:LemA protein
VELRNQVKSQEGLSQDRIQKEDQISRDLEKIQVQVEDYPDLKASDNFIQLQQSLNEVEEQLSAARRFLNSAVKNYHDSIQMFPHRIIAGMLNFQEQEYFETGPAEREDVTIRNLFSE